MALGDGIRYNVATVSAEERRRLRDAMLELHKRLYPGQRTDPIPGGVTYWFKQDEIHQATHVHGGPAFLPWHRELCNRYEALLRQVDPEISLHYWDYTTDPRPLFTAEFLGSANGQAGEPWLSAGFYKPGATPFRSDNPFDPVNNNPADPPRSLARAVAQGPPPVGTTLWPTDSDILAATTYPQMRDLLERAHNQAHGYIGGNLGQPHISFRDPFVFLLHSNVDRLFAMWQTIPGQKWRLDPNQVYGSETNDPEIIEDLEPWAATPPSIRPWVPPEGQAQSKTCRHPSVVAPPRYDTTVRPNVGRIMVADFSGAAPPAAVRYWEDWGNNPLFDGWQDDNDWTFVGDFMHRGYDQLLSTNRD
jgi:Common central domain of tyrosinase